MAGALSVFGCGKPNTKADGGTALIGPGLQCDSTGKNAWATYGKSTFFAITHDLVTLLTTDTTGKLGDSVGKIGSGSPPSTRDGAATFEGNLAAYLVYIYGGPTSITYTDGKTYGGVQDMQAAHAGLGITQTQYDYFVSLYAKALKDNGILEGSGGAQSPDDVNNCFAPAITDGNFSATILNQ